MARNLDIPPPLTEENKERYLEELSNFIEYADDWIERHSLKINLTMALTNLNITMMQKPLSRKNQRNSMKS